jgi:enoyl-[acyl-carrier protein] reductase I
VPQHTISPGPPKTRAASNIKEFELVNEAANEAPLKELVDIMGVGFTCADLGTPFAQQITGGTVNADGGTGALMNTVYRAQGRMPSVSMERPAASCSC